MFTLIHGEDITSSRKALTEIKEKNDTTEKIIFDGTKITLSDFVSAADSLSIFNQGRLIIIENFLSGILSKEKEEMLKYMQNTDISAQIIFWEQKEVSKTIIKKYFPKASVILCPVPVYIFKFLDSIGERPLPEVLSMYNSLAKQQEAEFVYSMLIRQWRNLLIANDLGQIGFSGMSSWQSGKFIRQAKYFDLQKLISSYRILLSLDQKVKSGQTSYNLNQLLDIFFVSLYYQN